MDAKLKHLEFIQGVVNRLASASFRMKGWSVVLVSALLVLLARSGQGSATVLVVLLPVAMFWALDGYFLSQERRFRRVYDHVRALSEKEIDFSMQDPAAGPHRPFRRWLAAAHSPTLLLFHGGLAAFALLVAWHVGGSR